MIITISGDPGSGKSTVAKRLAKRLHYEYYYIGGIRRKMAKKRGLTLEEYNNLGEKNPITDIEADKYTKELSAKKNNFILDGRLGWHFIPQSFKIYLKINPKIGAKRVLGQLKKKAGGNTRNEGKNLDTVESVVKSHEKRKKSDDKRYKKYYGVQAFKMKNYDFVLDTSKLSLNGEYAAVLNAVLRKIKKA